ncbi:MAG: TIGR03915 family putative DNA repair protein, partial [Thermotaleaceae bacterium]
MLSYIYDGSFEGLLTCIYEAYYRKESPVKILGKEEEQENLLLQKVYIDTNEEKADKVYNAIRTKISPKALHNVFYVFLSESEESGIMILKYIQLGFKLGKDIDEHLAEDRVLHMHKLVKKVWREEHFLLGLIRFKKLHENFYYASIEPEYHVLGLVAPHFAKRMADQNWVIHDIKRNMGAVYNQQEWTLQDMNLKEPPRFGQEEE